MNNKITKVVIAGGGTAGWMTAAALGKLIGKNLQISLIESDAIGTVGVGEATIPTLHVFHQLLGINEQQMMAATNATFKLGINFENWYQQQHQYLHSFGFLGKPCWACGFQHFWLRGNQLGMVSEIGDYCTEHLAAREGRFAILPKQDYNHAYHFDASLYAKFLRKIAEQHGVKRIEGKIEQVTTNVDTGYIEQLTLADGQQIAGDLFIDCTGFRALLIEQTLHTGFDDWSHYLPCDSAIAVQTESTQQPVPYTRSIARDAGWQWRIPLQHRNGNGLVFCSKYMSDEAAIEQLVASLDSKPLTQPRVIKFTTGTRRQHWHKNCVAIGLSSGFLEPLESTSIHLIQRSIVRLMQMFPAQGINNADVNEFNQQTQQEMENIRDFLVLHYKATERTDTPFWQHCQRMPIPASLQHRIDLFSCAGKIYKDSQDLFGETSWTQVMMGQGIMPQQYHPIVDMMPEQELQRMLDSIKQSTRQQVNNLPNHMQFIAHYCNMNQQPKAS